MPSRLNSETGRGAPSVSSLPGPIQWSTDMALRRQCLQPLIKPAPILSESLGNRLSLELFYGGKTTRGIRGGRPYISRDPQQQALATFCLTLDSHLRSPTRARRRASRRCRRVRLRRRTQPSDRHRGTCPPAPEAKAGFWDAFDDSFEFESWSVAVDSLRQLLDELERIGATPTDILGVLLREAANATWFANARVGMQSTASRFVTSRLTTSGDLSPATGSPGDSWSGRDREDNHADPAARPKTDARSAAG